MLNEDYKDILSELLTHKAEFILVGAYAMAAHGFPRATMDIDLWVKPSAENAAKVLKALAAFGAPLDEISLKDFTEPEKVFQIGVAPRRIDILTSISGVEFNTAKMESVSTHIDGYEISVLCIADLITNKRATGRTKDMADVETLNSLGGNSP